MVIRDDPGAQIGTGSLAVAANGHYAFVLSSTYPGHRQSARHDRIRHAGRRQDQCAGHPYYTLDSSNTLTTIPALANVGTNGGSITHIATGNGWQTTFVLVNAGSEPGAGEPQFLR